MSDHQRRALVAYEALMSDRPELFRDRARRRIVTDPDILKTHAAENELVLGVAAANPYVLLVVDLVEAPDVDGQSIRYPYMRVLSQPQLQGGTNVVVLATIESPGLGDRGSVVFVDQERHALGTREVELPRGFGTAGLSSEETALRELREESGYVGTHAHLLGSTTTDSGLTDATVTFYHVPATARTAPNPESQEAVFEVLVLPRPEVWSRIASGHIRDGFTLQALALYERSTRTGCRHCARP